MSVSPRQLQRLIFLTQPTPAESYLALKVGLLLDRAAELQRERDRDPKSFFTRSKCFSDGEGSKK